MKIQGQNKEMLATACQMFMGKSEGEIANIALETLEGHQRAIIAHLTVEVGVPHTRAVAIHKLTVPFVSPFLTHDLTLKDTSLSLLQ